MSAANATPNPIYGQAYRFAGKIVSAANGNPITGGLTFTSSQVSKDGAAFVNLTNTPTEIGTSGYFVVDLTAAEMSFASVIVRVAASNPNAVEFSIYIPICNLTPFTGRFDAQAVLRIEQLLLDIQTPLWNQNAISGSTQTFSLPGGSVKATGGISNDGFGNATRGQVG
jgi:hypothetical protein